MTIQTALKCIILWLMLIVMMILHFNYHVGEIFYGIDIVRENANGTVPISTHIIRGIFYHLPIIWILLLLVTDAKALKITLFFVSLVYTFAHGMHLVGELGKPDISQVSLLILTFITSIILNIEHYKYWKVKRVKQATPISEPEKVFS